VLLFLLCIVLAFGIYRGWPPRRTSSTVEDVENTPRSLSTFDLPKSVEPHERAPLQSGVRPDPQPPEASGIEPSDVDEELERLVARYASLPETLDMASRRFEILAEIASLEGDPRELQHTILELITGVDPQSEVRTDSYVAAGCALGRLWRKDPDLIAEARERLHWEENSIIIQALMRACSSHRDSDELFGLDEDLLWLVNTRVDDPHLRKSIAANIGFFSSRWGVGADAVADYLQDPELRVPSVHGACGMIDNYERLPESRTISAAHRDALVDGLIQAANDPGLRGVEFRRIVQTLARVPECLGQIDRSAFERHNVPIPTDNGTEPR